MTHFAADIARYKSKGETGKALWLNPAVWVIAGYRLARWAHSRRPFFLIRFPLKVVVFVLNKLCEIFMQMSVDPSSTIGAGLYIGHIGGVHINPGAVIGMNCDIAHGVTIGASGMGRGGAPVIGDDVYIGTGAVLIGRITIGSGAKIAANTLVLSNVPAGATVMGVPGRIIMRAGPAKSLQRSTDGVTQ